MSDIERAIIAKQDKAINAKKIEAKEKNLTGGASTTLRHFSAYQRPLSIRSPLVSKSSPPTVDGATSSYSPSTVSVSRIIATTP